MAKPRPAASRRRCAIRPQVAHHSCRRGETELERVGGLEDRNLVLLHILAIGQRQALHHRQQRDQRAVQPPGFGSHQFGGIGVALLRHDRAAGGKGVGQRDKPEPVAAPEHNLFGKARNVGPGERRRGEKFDREIPVRYGIERVCRRPVEAQRRSGRRAVDRERGARKSGGAERRFVHPAPTIGKPPAVAPDHFHIGHQVVAQRHRLGDLEMGEARHHRIGFGLGAIDQRLLQVAASLRRGGRSRRAATAADRSRLGRCANARCAGGRRPARSVRPGAPRHSGECPHAPR